MAQETPLLVEVTDQAGAALPVDKITLTQGGSSESQTAAPFSFKLTAAGAAAIKVEKNGHHTYQFDLEIKDAGVDFTVAMAKSMVDAPRMVTLVKEAGAGPGRNRMRLEIRPTPREFLLVVGFDYPTDHSGGMAFEGLGTKRMNDLRQSGILDDSTVITMFDAKSGLRTRWVMGRGSEKLGAPGNFSWKSGWCRMTKDGTKPATLNPKAPRYPGPGVFGMPEVYRHIEEIGRLRAESLEEFSILSHSWQGGPILFNTDESPPFKRGGATPDLRDPADRDGRFWKDFNAVNMPNRANFKAAFSASPFVRIWGCLAVSKYRTLINRARRAASDTTPLGVPARDRTSFFDRTVVFDDNRLGIIRYFRESALKANYMSFLASAIGKPVFGGAPGMGSLFQVSKLGLNLFVNREDVASPQGTIRGLKPEMEFLESRLGSVFTSDGYHRYDP